MNFQKIDMVIWCGHNQPPSTFREAPLLRLRIHFEGHPNELSLHLLASGVCDEQGNSKKELTSQTVGALFIIRVLLVMRQTTYIAELRRRVSSF